MPDDVVDVKAREIAADARSAAGRANERISDHQKACGHQYDRVEASLGEIKTSLKDLENKTVSNDSFNAVKIIAYGMVGLLVAGVVTAMVNTVIK